MFQTNLLRQKKKAYTRSTGLHYSSIRSYLGRVNAPLLLCCVGARHPPTGGFVSSSKSWREATRVFRALVSAVPCHAHVRVQCTDWY